MTQPRAPAGGRACAQDARRVRAACLLRAACGVLRRYRRSLGPVAQPSATPRTDGGRAGAVRATMASGGPGVSRSRGASPSAGGSGLRMAVACVCVLSGRTTCGPATSSRAGPTTGAASECLPVIDQHIHECLALPVAGRLNSDDVLAVLPDLFVQRGPPEHIRSDNGGSDRGPGGAAKAPKRVHRDDGAQLTWPPRGEDGVRRARSSGIGPPDRSPILLAPSKNGYDERFGRQAARRADRPEGLPRPRRGPRADRSALGYYPPAPATVVPPKVEAPWVTRSGAQRSRTASTAQEVPMP